MIFLGKKLFDDSFDKFAHSYHDVRPGYPLQMFNDIEAVCNINQNSRVLEIGAGSGIATKQFANFGCEIIAIEPGISLSSIAKNELASFANVKLICNTFEEFNSSKPFDILFSATAFHWITPSEKYSKTDELLDNKGFLVLAWNSFCQSNTNAAIEIDNLYKKAFPNKKYSSDPNIQTLNRIIAREQEILSTDMFYFVFMQRYVTHYIFNPENYAMLMNTFPNIINMDKNDRDAFLKEIIEIVTKYRQITVPIMTNLYICKKKKDFTQFLASK